VSDTRAGAASAAPSALELCDRALDLLYDAKRDPDGLAIEELVTAVEAIRTELARAANREATTAGL
jgi:hypothetical protein